MFVSTFSICLEYDIIVCVISIDSCISSFSAILSYFAIPCLLYFSEGREESVEYFLRNSYTIDVIESLLLCIHYS